MLLDLTKKPVIKRTLLDIFKSPVLTIQTIIFAFMALQYFFCNVFKFFFEVKKNCLILISEAQQHQYTGACHCLQSSSATICILVTSCKVSLKYLQALQHLSFFHGLSFLKYLKLSEIFSPFFFIKNFILQFRTKDNQRCCLSTEWYCTSYTHIRSKKQLVIKIFSVIL